MPGFKQKRVNTAPTAGAAPKVTLGAGGGKDIAVTFEPGAYKVTIETAETIFKASTGTTSFALTMRDAESEALINLPPIWMGGGKTAGRITPALQINHAAVMALVEAAGGAAEGLDLDAAGDLLTGVTLYVDLGTDQISGRECNRLLNAASVEDYEG